MNWNETADIVVIGSGIGGLAAARLLAEFGGRKVLVLEQHYTLGGMTHEFTRQGRYHFGTGVHYMTGKPGPALNHLTDGRVYFRPLPDDYDILHFPDEDFAVPASRDAFMQCLKDRFPSERDAIDRFFATVRKASRGMLARHIVSALPPVIRRGLMPLVEWSHADTFATIKGVVDRHFADPRLRAVVSARWGLYGAPPSTSAFGGHAAVGIEGFIDGASFPVGGSRELGRAIMAGAERHGVVFKAQQRVRQIVVSQGRALGVVVEDLQSRKTYTVGAKAVVSAIGVRNTGRLLGEPHLSHWQRELAKIPREIGALLLFIGFKRSPVEVGLAGENHWFMPSLDDDAALRHPLGEGVLFVSFTSLNNPAARHHVAEVMQFVDPEDFTLWFGSDAARRPDDYLVLKAQITRRLMDRLQLRWPGIENLVDHVELATPVTFETFQGSAHGAIYGLANSPERLRSTIASCRTDIGGLYLAGQDAASPGIEAALWSGAMVANAILPGRAARRMWRDLGRGRTPPLSDPWRGYLSVSQVNPISRSVVMLRFAAPDGSALPFRFRAGQYVRLGLPIEDDLIERSYSIVSAPSETSYFEIAVKLEPDGLGSAFLHHEIRVGDALQVSGPLGEFVVDLPKHSGRGGVLMLAGGVGITPFISQLRQAAADDYFGPITLLASSRTAEDVLFRSELQALQQRLPCLDVVHYLTREQTPAFGIAGRIGRAALASYLVDVDVAELCGPPMMMRAMIGELTALGLPREAIRVEAFTDSRSRVTRPENARRVIEQAEREGIATFAISAGSGETFPCRPGQTVLSAAGEGGIAFSQSCHEGICGRCRARILSGEYLTSDHGQFSDEELQNGWVLACQTLPSSDLVLMREAGASRPDPSEEQPQFSSRSIPQGRMAIFQ